MIYVIRISRIEIENSNSAKKDDAETSWKLLENCLKR